MGVINVSYIEISNRYVGTLVFYDGSMETFNIKTSTLENFISYIKDRLNHKLFGSKLKSCQFGLQFTRIPILNVKINQRNIDELCLN